MKKLLILAAGLLLGHVVPAQTVAAVSPAAREATLPAYVYCEIIAGHMPSYTGGRVLFDFGQQTEAWAYNWLRNADGGKLLFNSGVEALNYMVFRGWEFVQAYVSGEDLDHTHFLLRLPSSSLTAHQREQLLAQPRSKPGKQSRQAGKAGQE